MIQSQPTEGKTLELEGFIEDSCCVKCLVLETRLKETMDELSSARVIIEILRSEVNIEMESLRNQCDSGNTNIKNTVGEQIDQLQINNERSEEVVGGSIDGQKEELISKMAESDVIRECYSHISVNISDNIGESICNKCVQHETLLKEALNELTSLPMINDLLQRDLTSHSMLKNTLQTDHNFTENTAAP